MYDSTNATLDLIAQLLADCADHKSPLTGSEIVAADAEPDRTMRDVPALSS